MLYKNFLKFFSAHKCVTRIRIINLAQTLSNLFMAPYINYLNIQYVDKDL